MKNFIKGYWGYFFVMCVMVGVFSLAGVTDAATMAQRMAGRILLQVQSKGEGWYVHPTELHRYYLGRPNDAFSIMRSTGLGVTNANLNRIAVSGSTGIGDTTFAKSLSGRILLQVQSNGEAWYVYPVNLKRYYLGRPTDAFALMRTLGLGITDSDISTIPVHVDSSVPVPVSTTVPDTTLTDNYEAQRTTILTDLNVQRNSHGLASVKLSALLSQAAQNHSDDMTSKGYYSLTSPDGTKATERVAVVGYKAHSVAVWLDSVPNGASAVISQWMTKSPANFSTLALSNDYREIGVGVATVNGTSAYVIIFAMSDADYFSTFTDALADLSKVRNDMLVRVNQERQNVGLSPLVFNDKLNIASQGHTDDMLAQGYYSHNSLDGRTPAMRITATGYLYQAMGENIAKGQRTVKEVMDDWMASPEHRANILNPFYEDIGIGLSFGKNTNGYEILWGQDFGKPR